MPLSMFESVFSEIFPFWSELSAGDKSFICDHSLALTYKKGAHVHDGEECSGVIFVKSGCLRQILSTEERFLQAIFSARSVDAPAYLKGEALCCSDGFIVLL